MDLFRGYFGGGKKAAEEKPKEEIAPQQPADSSAVKSEENITEETTNREEQLQPTTVETGLIDEMKTGSNGAGEVKAISNGAGEVKTNSNDAGEVKAAETTQSEPDIGESVGNDPEKKDLRNESWAREDVEEDDEEDESDDSGTDRRRRRVSASDDEEEEDEEEESDEDEEEDEVAPSGELVAEREGGMKSERGPGNEVDAGASKLERKVKRERVKKDPSVVPRSTRYFLHDDRDADSDEEAVAKEETADVAADRPVRRESGGLRTDAKVNAPQNSNSSSYNKKKSNRQDDDDFMWKHDKFESLMREEEILGKHQNAKQSHHQQGKRDVQRMSNRSDGHRSERIDHGGFDKQQNNNGKKNGPPSQVAAVDRSDAGRSNKKALPTHETNSSSTGIGAKSRVTKPSDNTLRAAINANNEQNFPPLPNPSESHGAANIDKTQTLKAVLSGGSDMAGLKVTPPSLPKKEDAPSAQYEHRRDRETQKIDRANASKDAERRGKTTKRGNVGPHESHSMNDRVAESRGTTEKFSQNKNYPHKKGPPVNGPPALPHTSDRAYGNYQQKVKNEPLKRGKVPKKQTQPRTDFETKEETKKSGVDHLAMLNPAAMEFQPHVQKKLVMNSQEDVNRQSSGGRGGRKIPGNKASRNRRNASNADGYTADTTATEEMYAHENAGDIQQGVPQIPPQGSYPGGMDIAYQQQMYAMQMSNSGYTVYDPQMMYGMNDPAGAAGLMQMNLQPSSMGSVGVDLGDGTVWYTDPNEAAAYAAGMLQMQQQGQPMDPASGTVYYPMQPMQDAQQQQMFYPQQHSMNQ